MRHLLVLLGVALAFSPVASAGEPGPNLVVNGSFEVLVDPKSAADSDADAEDLGPVDIADWRLGVDGGMMPMGRLELDLYGGAFLFRNPPADAGDYVLLGGFQDYSAVHQIIDLTPLAIDGDTRFILSGSLGGFNFEAGAFPTNQEDQAFLGVVFRDALGEDVGGAAVEGPTIASQVGLDFSIEGSFSALVSARGAVPADAVTALVRIEFVVDEDLPGSFNNANADLIGLRFFQCPADLAANGILNFNDIVGYLSLLAQGDPAADLAEPIGTLNFNDVIAFLNLFAAGCP